MKIFKLRAEIAEFCKKTRSQGKTIGFVPTMGALHTGHLKLVEQALAENDIVICSIFVNPIQFNNPDDLNKYPRTFNEDIAMLENLDCTAVFSPDVNEMYPEPATMHYDFGLLDKVMEGKFRPGHFNGVAIVVSRLFKIVGPHKAYFGEKDYQQLAIIRKLVEIENSPVDVVACKTIREHDGLAMSSRNKRLSERQRKEAPLIYKALSSVPDLVSVYDLDRVKNDISETINANPEMKLEYFEISDAITLSPLQNPEKGTKAVACIAVFMGDVRLIDNIIFNC